MHLRLCVVSRLTILTIAYSPRAPSTQTIPTLGSKACKYCLLRAIWSLRVIIYGSLDIAGYRIGVLIIRGSYNWDLYLGVPSFQSHIPARAILVSLGPPGAKREFVSSGAARQLLDMGFAAESV